jgi:hypothetical protein
MKIDDEGVGPFEGIDFVKVTFNGHNLIFDALLPADHIADGLPGQGRDFLNGY